MLTFGERLKRSRERCVWTQLELGEKAGIINNHIARLEAGKIPQPRPKTIRTLARALGVRAEWLATGEGRRS